MLLLFAEGHLKLVDYPADVAAIESLAVRGRLVYFAVCAKGPRTGGLYSFNLAGGPVDVLLNNETNSCSEIKRVASLKGFWPLLILELPSIPLGVLSACYTNWCTCRPTNRTCSCTQSTLKVVTVLVGSGQKGN